jgi:hypothetical protein
VAVGAARAASAHADTWRLCTEVLRDLGLFADDDGKDA